METCLLEIYLHFQLLENNITPVGPIFFRKNNTSLDSHIDEKKI